MTKFTNGVHECWLREKLASFGAQNTNRHQLSAVRELSHLLSGKPPQADGNWYVIILLSL